MRYLHNQTLNFYTVTVQNMFYKSKNTAHAQHKHGQCIPSKMYLCSKIVHFHMRCNIYTIFLHLHFHISVYHPRL